jgi:hypothetical protein
LNPGLLEYEEGAVPAAYLQWYCSALIIIRQ